MVQIQKFDIKIKLGNGSIKLRNLFNGDKVLGKCHLRRFTKDKNMKKNKIHFR